MSQFFEEHSHAVAQNHHDVIKFAEHLLQGLNGLEEQVRRQDAFDAEAGHKINGEAVKRGNLMLDQVRELIRTTLENTEHDWFHKGDKNEKPIFKDGVE